MRVDLSELGTKTLNLQLSPRGTIESERQYVRILESHTLSGVFETTEQVVRLTNAQAHKAAIDALRLMFGSVVLEAVGGTELTRISTDYLSSDDGLDMTILMGTLDCPTLRIEVGSIIAEAGLRLEQGRVRVTSGGGKIEVPGCSFENFSLSISGVQLSSPDMRVKNLLISWGDGGFELHAEEVETASLTLEVDSHLARFKELKAAQLDVKDADWSIKELVVEGTSVRITSDETAEESADETMQPAARVVAETSPAPVAVWEPKLPLFVRNLLDALSGHVHVDLGVDLKVPLIQHRRAVHHLRVPIEAGRINFVELEHNLALPEDLLLDFSVRDENLVLELGIPFLPTRGHGKPLVRWALSPEEREVAQDQRLVRLATLVRPEVVAGEADLDQKAQLPPGPTDPDLQAKAASDESTTPPGSLTRAPDGDGDSSNGSSPLEQLTLRNIDVELALEKTGPMDALLKHLEVGALRLTGELVHRTTGEKETTQVHGSLRDIGLSVDDFPLAGRRFDLNRIRLEGESRFEAELENLKLKNGSMNMGRLRAKSIDFGVYAEASVEG